jgi:hypothetical protein
MGNKIQIKFSGFKEVDDVLKNLPKQVQRKILLGAQREVLKPVARDIQSNLSKVAGRVTGNLQDSVGIKAFRGGREYNAASLAGVRYGNRYKGFHGRFIEEGTKERRAKRGKKLKFINKEGEEIYVTKVAAIKKQPFIAPAIESNMPSIEANYPEAILKSMTRFMKRKLK